MKKLLFIYFLSVNSLFSIEHNFYFSNDLILEDNPKSNTVVSEKPLLMVEKNIYNKIKINITTMNIQKKSTKKNLFFNPLPSLFKSIGVSNPSPKTKSFLIEDNQYYVLNIKNNNSNNSYKFLKVDSSKKIESYTKNKFNIILKPNISKGTIYILNKKESLSLNDSFIINIDNKKITLKYEKTNQFI